MSATFQRQQVRDYLDRVDAALSELPYRQARELREQIAAHIADAVPPDAPDVQVVAILDRLGSPDEIAAEAVHGYAIDGSAKVATPVRTDQSTSARTRPGRGRRLGLAALVAWAVCASAVALTISLTRGGEKSPLPNRSTPVQHVSARAIAVTRGGEKSPLPNRSTPVQHVSARAMPSM